MRRYLLILAGVLSLGSTVAKAANSTVSAMTAASALGGTELLYVVQGAADRKGTPAQFATYIYGLASGDCTISSLGAVVCTKTNGVAFGALATVTPGTGVAAALGINIGSAGAFTTFNGAHGTPSSIVLTNGTGLPIAGITGLATGIATWLATPSSANLAAALTDETGSGSAVFGTAPTISSLNATVAMTLAYITGSTQCLQVNTSGAVSGTGSACGSGGGTGANPTATAGPAAVNGVATTFMRSDGAPAVQLATAAQKGIAQVDGATILASSGVISVPVGCGLNTASGTAAVNSNVTATNNTGTTDTITSTACGTTVTENNAASIAVAITTSGMASGNYFTVKDLGAGVATYTPSSGTIDGAGTLVCKQNQSADIYFDGTNYKTLASSCGLGTASTANTGTSGATLPFLNGTNTFSGTQTFGSVFGTVTTQSGTTYTLAAADCGTQVSFTNAAAITVTIPAALTTGCNIAILQTTSAGQVTVTGTAVSAATLHSAHSYTKTFGQWAIIGINIYTTGVAILTGDGA